jgi:hypothetical protein
VCLFMVTFEFFHLQYKRISCLVIKAERNLLFKKVLKSKLNCYHLLLALLYPRDYLLEPLAIFVEKGQI